MAAQYRSRLGNVVSRQREEQIRHPERHQARQAVVMEIRAGRLPKASDRKCFFCGRAAEQYDHYLGYDKEHRLDVRPVCDPCHRSRGFKMPREKYRHFTDAVMVRLEGSDLEELDAIAAEEQNTRSGIIRLALARFLAARRERKEVTA